MQLSEVRAYVDLLVFNKTCACDVFLSTAGILGGSSFLSYLATDLQQTPGISLLLQLLLLYQVGLVEHTEVSGDGTLGRQWDSRKRSEAVQP